MYLLVQVCDIYRLTKTPVEKSKSTFLREEEGNHLPAEAGR